jgi:hypothetical protein
VPSWSFSREFQNTHSYYFNGSNTTLSAGTGAALDLSKTQKKIFSGWFKLASGVVSKGEILSRELAVPPYNGYALMHHDDRKIRWYETQDYGANNFHMSITTNPLPNDGATWVHVVCSAYGGTHAGTKIWFNGVQQVLTINHDNLVGDSTDPTLEYKMGNYTYDTGSVPFHGHMNNFAIILGQDCDLSFINTYLRNESNKPKDLRGTPGLAHWWRYAQTNGTNPDTTATVYDRVGGMHLTLTAGTGAIQAVVP